MKYEEAIKRWGAKKLEQSITYKSSRWVSNNFKVDPGTVTVWEEMYKGWQSDDSFAEDPSMNFNISGVNKETGNNVSIVVQMSSYSLASLLEEIMES